MQLFVIETVGGTNPHVATMVSSTAKETEKMFIVEWEKEKFPYTSRLNREKEYTLNEVLGTYSMWGRDNEKLIQRFHEAMKEVLEKQEKEIVCIKSYLKEDIAFSAPSVKSDKKSKPKKKRSLKIVKSSKV